jgi:hypothetical protein
MSKKLIALSIVIILYSAWLSSMVSIAKGGILDGGSLGGINTQTYEGNMSGSGNSGVWGWWRWMFMF